MLGHLSFLPSVVVVVVVIVVVAIVVAVVGDGNGCDLMTLLGVAVARIGGCKVVRVVAVVGVVVVVVGVETVPVLWRLSLVVVA